MHTRICLFAQFDPSGRVPGHVLRYLAHLGRCGFAIHIACSGATALDADTSAALRRIGAVPHFRPNIGHDFGAWQHLLRAGCADGAGETLFANDSVFGPFGDLAPIFGAMRTRNPDAWGMVASREGVWHLQSWFLCLSARALAHPAIRRVFDQPFQVMSREEVILHGELGLGTAIRAAGLPTAAVFDDRPQNPLRQLVRINPMHIDWAWMLTSGGVPFVKTGLLRDNPIGVPWVRRWPEICAPLSSEIARDIEAALGDAPEAGRAAAPPRVRWKLRLLYLLLTRDKRLALRSLRDASFERVR